MWFVEDLKRKFTNKPDSCEFDEKKPEFIRDRIVCGIHSDTVRKLLLKEPELTLDKAKEICLMHELAEDDNKDINADPDVQTSTVNAIKSRRPKPQPRKFTQTRLQSAEPMQTRNCKYCGRSHTAKLCPAFGKQCTKCKKCNRFAHVCLSTPGRITQPRQQYNSQRRRSRPNNGQMHEIDCENYEDIEDPEDLMQNFIIESVEIPNSQNEIHITANISNTPLELKIDSGGKCNVISIGTLKALRIPFEIDSTKESKPYIIFEQYHHNSRYMSFELFHFRSKHHSEIQHRKIKGKKHSRPPRCLKSQFAATPSRCP